MNATHTARLLENAERRTVVLERICKQQEIELNTQRHAYDRLRTSMSQVQRTNDEFIRWHNKTKWQKIKHLLGFKQ